MCSWRPTSPCHPNGSLLHLMDAEFRSFTSFATSDSWDSWVLRQANCTMPAEGQFACKPRRPATVNCCTAPLAGGSNGTWVSGSRWVASEGCAARPLPLLGPGELLSCLAGRAVLFVGDSFTRQLFLRLVWWMRGLPVIIEHYFHRHAAYSLNATHDSLEILSGRLTTYKTATSVGPVDLDAEAEMLRRVRTLRRSEVLLLFQLESIGGYPLARGGRRRSSPVPVSELAAVIRGASGRFTLRMQPANSTSTRPRRRGSLLEETLSLDTMRACGGAAHYFERNYFGVGATGALDAQHVRGQRAHGWATPAGMRLRALADQDAHFQCGFVPEWPAGPVSGWKMPPNGDCRDLLGLNAAHALLGRICSVHSH